MSAAGKRVRVTVPLAAPAGAEPGALTLATANIVHVTGLPGQPVDEEIIPGATVARLLVAADEKDFDHETIGCELRGLAQLVGEYAGDNEPWAYSVELALQSIARRVEAMREPIPVDRYQVRAVEIVR